MANETEDDVVALTRIGKIVSSVRTTCLTRPNPA